MHCKCKFFVGTVAELKGSDVKVLVFLNVVNKNASSFDERQGDNAKTKTPDDAKCEEYEEMIDTAAYYLALSRCCLEVGKIVNV